MESLSLMRARRAAVVCWSAMGVIGAYLSTAALSPAVAQDRPSDWPSFNRTLAGDRYAPQTAVTPASAKQLKQICSYKLDRQTSFQTGPLVINNTIYVTTDFDTIAIDGTTCAQKWRTTESYTPVEKSLKVNRGAAFADGRIFRGTQDGRVLAYDAATGKRLWQTTIADPSIGETVPSALISWHGLVFAGTSGGDSKGIKGRMNAIDAESGKVIWEQFLVPRALTDKTYGPLAPAPAMAAGDWGSVSGEGISGAGTWTSYSLDVASGTLYVPAGNPAPAFAKHLRPGPNQFADNLVAMDAKTGAVKASYALVPRDFHDWDVSAAPAMFTTRGGVKMAAEAIKSGYVYGIDTAKGGQLWSVATTTIANATAPLVASGTRFCPGTQGGTEWNGPSYSPRTNLVYVGTVDWCSTAWIKTDAEIKAIKTGQLYAGSNGPSPFGQMDPVGVWAGWVTAIDADKGTVAWKRKFPTPILSTTTPTAGGVVLTADMAGNIYALNDATGEIVWQTQTIGAVGGGIVSYATAAGEQRIAVAAGMVSPIWASKTVNAELVVYGLQ